MSFVWLVEVIMTLLVPKKLEKKPHYIVVWNVILLCVFPQRASTLKQFVGNILGVDNDITHFEYSKKHDQNLVFNKLSKKQGFNPV